MYTADAGKAGLGLADGRMMMPRGKMLGGSSGINYMAYVRGHPGDFDAWAAGGATGWSYDDVLPYFKKSEGLAPSGDIVVDADAHNTDGSAGGLGALAGARAARRSSSTPPSRPGSPSVTTTAATAAGPTGVVSLLQTTTRDGKRSSTYHAFLEGDVEQRPNLDGDHRRAGDARAPGGRPGRLSATRRRVPHRRRRDRTRSRQQRGRAERRRDRLAAHAAAVGHRTAARARGRRGSRASSTRPTSAST